MFLNTGYILFLVALVRASISQQPPPSPCPGIVQYKNEGNQWVGIINAPNPPPIGVKIVIKVKLSLNVDLPTAYVGKLDIDEEPSIVLTKIGNNAPIRYKVYFPLLYPIPNVLTVIFNDVVICSGPPAQGKTQTTLDLYHVFYSGYKSEQSLNSFKYDSEKGFVANNYKNTVTAGDLPLGPGPGETNPGSIYDNFNQNAQNIPSNPAAKKESFVLTLHKVSPDGQKKLEWEKELKS